MSYPDLMVDVDRERAAEVGVNQSEVANNLLTSLSSSVGIAPNFFLSPVNGVNYLVGVQMPMEKVTTVNELMNMPINTPAAGNHARHADGGAGDTAVRYRLDRTHQCDGVDQPLHGSAHHRCGRQCGRPRSGRRGQRHPEGDGPA